MCPRFAGAYVSKAVVKSRRFIPAWSHGCSHVVGLQLFVSSYCIYLLLTRRRDHRARRTQRRTGFRHRSLGRATSAREASRARWKGSANPWPDKRKVESCERTKNNGLYRWHAALLHQEIGLTAVECSPPGIACVAGSVLCWVGGLERRRGNWEESPNQQRSATQATPGKVLTTPNAGSDVRCAGLGDERSQRQPAVYTYDASTSISTSARSFFLRLCLRRPGSHMACACAYACV